MRVLASAVASLLVASSGCGVEPATAGPDRKWEACETNGCSALLLGIRFVDSRCGVAVGGTTERGASVILRTSDRGATWSPARVATKGRLYAVAFSGKKRGCAVGFGVIVTEHVQDPVDHQQCKLVVECAEDAGVDARSECGRRRTRRPHRWPS